VPNVQPLSDHDHHREQHALEAFAKRRSAPKATFALVLMAVAVASMSMSFDEVERYSPGAFMAGLVTAAALAIAIGVLIDMVKDAAWRTVATIALPTGCGAAIGVMVQALVLMKTGTGWEMAVKDLGGLVDTTQPVTWLMAGVLLGGAPALVVSVFLLLASRALKRLSGHDASEGFGVAFVGTAGIVAAFGLFVVKGMAVVPLFLVTIASALTVLVAVLIDGSRIAFLRRVYARTGESFDIVPRAQFASDPTLAPMVAAAGGGSVLVRLPTASFRAAAMEPIALVADTMEDTLRPLLRRRRTAALVLFGTTLLTSFAVMLHA
jgi:MFS family permease